MNDHKQAEKNTDEIRPRLIEGEDFYFENGLMVLTAEFLRKRGYCCNSGCRHCPYPKESEPDKTG